MTDQTGKPWMDIGETDDPNAIIDSFKAYGAISKGVPVYLNADGTVSSGNGSYNAYGISMKTVADGQMCPVLHRGRVKVTADSAFDANGCAVRSAGNTKVTELYDQEVDEGGAAKYTIYTNRKFATALNKPAADGNLIFINVEH